jgi:hypothetical protein
VRAFGKMMNLHTLKFNIYLETTIIPKKHCGKNILCVQEPIQGQELQRQRCKNLEYDKYPIRPRKSILALE